MAKIEALYQILRVTQEADIDEHIRQAAIDNYATHIDLIDAKQRNAEQWGEHAAQLAGISNEPDPTRRPDRDEHRQREYWWDGSEERLLQNLRKQLTKKCRYQSPMNSSDSDDISTSARGEETIILITTSMVHSWDQCPDPWSWQKP